jgi:hypothetical protein
MENTSLPFYVVGLIATLVAATVGWLVRPRWATIALAALTLVGLGTLGVVAAAAIEPPDAGSDAVTAVYTLAGLLAVIGGGPITTAVFKLVDGSHASEASSVRSAGEVLRGGAWIGALERAAVFSSVVAGWPEGVAIVLGLKGLGRYPELRNQQHTGTAERFIIGTFTSVLWAVGCAAFVHLLLG